MPLTGPQLARIHEAILAAYTRDELARMVKFCLSQDFEALVPDKAFSDQVFALVEWADRTGGTLDLVQCAWANNQGNAGLAALWTEMQERGVPGISPAPAPSIAAQQRRAEQERARYHSLLVDFLNPLDDYLRYTYSVFEKLQKETGIDHFHRDPEGLKRIFAGLSKKEVRCRKWMETIDHLQDENRKIVKLIENNYGYDDIVLPEFRDACQAFKRHANDWAIFWKILKEQGIDTPPEVYADIVSMPFPRSFQEALQNELANARGHASAGE